MDDRYIVETPEIVAVAYDVAGLGSRCLAAIIDTLLILALQIAIGVALLVGVGQLVGDLESLTSLLLAIWAIVSFLLLWGYYLLFELIWSGQSPGKRAIGLRVVREGGRPLTPAASAVRNLIRIVDFLPFFYGLGALVMFVDARSRRLGDLAAGSLVVREGAAVTLESLTSRPPPVSLPPRPSDAPATPLLPNLHLLHTDDYDLAEEFLRRRVTLAADRRAALGAQLANTLCGRLDLGFEAEPERFLEHLVREYRVYRAQQQS